MKDRGLLFKCDMALAVLEDRKTQTRRVVKSPNNSAVSVANLALMPPSADGTTHKLWWRDADGNLAGAVPDCPYGKPGGRIWGRETYYAFGYWEQRYSDKKGRDEWHFVDKTIENGYEYLYAASMSPEDQKCFERKREAGVFCLWKRPAIFMPHVASRIELEIVSVRVERLNAISEQDATAEGVAAYTDVCCNSRKPFDVSATQAFCNLWSDINGFDQHLHGSSAWDANPWVWAIQFKKVSCVTQTLPLVSEL